MENMDLFASPVKEKTLPQRRLVPLAERMRPLSLENLVGQQHLVGEGMPLRRMIEKDSFGSMIFWGPPGSGKTTLARIIANLTHRRFEELSAVTSGVADLRKIIEASRKFLSQLNKRTILFIDEIHRYNKAQQDALLPHVEKGELTLIGATTENPSFEVIPALRSRCRIYTLNPLSTEEIKELLYRALSDKKNGLSVPDLEIEPKGVEHIALLAGGDARFTLNVIEAAAASIEKNDNGISSIDLKTVEDIVQKTAVRYDKMGSEHFDHASAFQKSMRGSDPDATVYWLAKMISGGEDPRFIARRMVVTAAEDVGNADPQAFILAIAAAQSVEKLGWPEARIPLAQAACYIATAPKSNSAVKAIDRALNDIEKKGKSFPVPNHLKPSSYSDASRYGFGGYQYPHDYPDQKVSQNYLPEKLAGTVYYEKPDHCKE